MSPLGHASFEKPEPEPTEQEAEQNDRIPLRIRSNGLKMGTIIEVWQDGEWSTDHPLRATGVSWEIGPGDQVARATITLRAQAVLEGHATVEVTGAPAA